ncbi:MAG: hypothetical protein MJK12_15965 [Colwellia sp.]|nr:hypothetical protein [Colwellia sp.]
MSNTYKALSLSTINASGTSERALYSALVTEMFFGQKSALEIRVDKGLAKPYFTVPLPELESLNTATKKQLLLVSCLQETEKQLKQLSATMPINTIEQLVIVTSMLSTVKVGDGAESSATESSDQSEQAKEEWQQLVKTYVNDYLPYFSNKVTFNYSHTPSLELTLNLNQLVKQGDQTEGFERPVLVITVESLLDYDEVKTLSKIIEVQCLQGPAGIMPSEAATSTLVIPSHYPDIKHKNVVIIEGLNSQQLSIKEQLIQAKFTLPNTVLHVGTISEQWVTHWYGQTNSFYHQQPPNDDELTAGQQADKTLIPIDLAPNAAKELTLYDQTKVLGYLGIANLTTAIASVTSLLTSPIENTSVVWLVEHHINSNNTQQPAANVYKITLAGCA